MSEEILDRGLENRDDEMRLGRLEFWAMNNPIRRFLQKWMELRIFRKLLAEQGIDLRGKTIWEVGCGSGYGAELLKQAFNPSRLIGFDYMPEQIALARRRGLDAEFRVGDVTDMDEESDSYDAVFIFGVLHHIVLWRKALHEIARVLRGNGVLLVEEPRYRYTWSEFENGIREAGLELLGRERFYFGYFRSYLGRKPAP